MHDGIFKFWQNVMTCVFYKCLHDKERRTDTKRKLQLCLWKLRSRPFYCHVMIYISVPPSNNIVCTTVVLPYHVAKTNK